MQEPGLLLFPHSTVEVWGAVPRRAFPEGNHSATLELGHEVWRFAQTSSSCVTQGFWVAGRGALGFFCAQGSASSNGECERERAVQLLCASHKML